MPKNTNADQYIDPQHPEHNLTKSQVELAHGYLAAHPAPGSSAPFLAYAEFSDQGGYNPSWETAEEDGQPGTYNLQRFTDLMDNRANAFSHGRDGQPTAVLVSLDAGKSRVFLSDYLQQAEDWAKL